MNKINKRLNKCEYSGVDLKDFVLSKQYQSTRDLYYELSNDSLLHGFRTRAGLEAPGESLGGAYALDIWHIFGQVLSAYAKMYRATNDMDILKKAGELVEEWGKTIEPDGYFYYSKKPNAPHYIYEKMVGGLVDMYYYANNEQALLYLEKITDWAIKNLERANKYAHNYGSGPTEWYTLPENLYRAYEVTGNEKYKEFADVFFYQEYYDLFLNQDYDKLRKLAEESKWKRYHAYSHVNCLNGAAMAYKVTGDERYLTVLKNAYEFLKETQMYVTGGFGPAETFMLHDGHKKECLYSEKFHFETPCGSWAAFKLAGHLLEFTGEAKYGDWIEKMIYNGIGAALPVGKKGEVMYASDYNVRGAKKENTTFGWVCCNGTYPNDVVEYYNVIYYINQDAIFVNLYIKSSLSCTVNDIPVQLEQETCYPVKDTSKFKISLPQTTKFSLIFRIPQWCIDGLNILVNGSPISYTLKDGWAIIDREWINSDEVIVKIPMYMQVNPVEKAQAFPLALTYGPVVLVAPQEDRPIIKESDINGLESRILRSSEDQLHFKAILSDNENLDLYPYYEMQQGQKYFMYLSPHEANMIDSAALKYGPNIDSWHNDDSWFSDGLCYIAKQSGSYFETQFCGSGIRLIGIQCDDAGILDIYIDNVLVDKADQYGPVTGVPWFWEKTELGNGQHTIRAISNGDKNASSAGVLMNIKHLSIL